MSDHSDTLHEVDQLFAEIAVAERAASLSRTAVATAHARMDGEIIAGISGYTPLAAILAVRMIALRKRLAAAQGYQG